MNWLVLQLADSAFPAGGFAHSAGLEAATHLAELKGGVAAFVEDALWQTGYGAVPFVGDAHRAPGDVASIDAACDAFLVAAVANRASRAQGRALASSCARSFGVADLERLYLDVRERRLTGHHAPLFGAIASRLGVARDDALDVWMHVTLRGLLSAAVRLGVVGAHEAQSLQRTMAPLLDRVLAECGALGRDAAAQTAPRLELVAGQHDRLYSRLFQS